MDGRAVINCILLCDCLPHTCQGQSPRNMQLALMASACFASHALKSLHKASNRLNSFRYRVSGPSGTHHIFNLLQEWVSTLLTLYFELLRKIKPVAAFLPFPIFIIALQRCTTKLLEYVPNSANCVGKCVLNIICFKRHLTCSREAHGLCGLHVRFFMYQLLYSRILVTVNLDFFAYDFVLEIFLWC